MPSIINTNIASLNAQLNLSRSQSTLQTSLQRLSSGLRINNAADDAAGLAISDRMTSQINGLDQAVRNANDAISLSQTAEGSLNTVDANLQRIRQLALQSANSTNSASDRAALNAEAQSLITEIQRVASTTQFNGINLLDGSFSNSQFQVGANANQTISVSTGNATTSALGNFGGAASSAVNREAFTATNSISINGTVIAPSAATTTPGWTAASAAAKAAAINAQTNVTGVSATASSNTTGNTPIINQALDNGDLTINGIAIGPISASASAVTQGANAAAAINLKTNTTGVSASSDSTTGKLTLTATDGRDITVSSASTSTATKVLNATGLAADTGQAATGAVSTATFGATVTSGSTVTLNGVTFTFQSTAASGVVDSTHVNVQIAGATDTGTNAATALAAAINTAAADSTTQSKLGQYGLTPATSSGLVTTVTNAKLGTTLTTGDAALAVGLGAITAATTDGTDYVHNTFTSQAPAFAEALNLGDLVINGTQIGAVAAGTSIVNQGSKVADAINLLTSTTGVTASADGTTGKLTLTSSVSGTPITVSAGSGKAEKVLTATGLTADSGTAPTQATAAVTLGATVTSGTTLVFGGVTFTFQTALATGVVDSSNVNVQIATSATTGTLAAAALQSAIAAAASSTVATYSKIGTYTATNTAGTLTVNVTDNKYGAGATTGEATTEFTSNRQTLSSKTITELATVTSGATVTLNGVIFTYQSTAATGVVDATHVNVQIASATDTGTNAATALAAAITAAKASYLTIAAIGNYSAAAVDVAVNITASNDTAKADVTNTNLTLEATISSGTTQVINGVTFTFQSTAASAVVDATHVNVQIAGATDTGTLAAAALQTAIGLAADVNALTYTAMSTYTATNTAATRVVGVVTTKDNTAGADFVGGVYGLTSGGALGSTAGGDLNLTSSNTFVVTGTGNGLIDAGLNTYTVGQTTLASVSIATVSGSNSAITTIDAALAQVNSLRANLGATQNRFTSTVSNLQTTSLNISAARSQIQDTNFAAETANLTRSQILQQAGTAMLSQANALPNLVLSLLK